ncbi:MAG: hypothetical protein Q4B84_01570 [Clostridia bacterium]|nr:hypothetical protein [Clostridia bacterium]
MLKDDELFSNGKKGGGKEQFVSFFEKIFNIKTICFILFSLREIKQY